MTDQIKAAAEKAAHRCGLHSTRQQIERVISEAITSCTAPLEAEVERLTDSMSWSEAKAHEDAAELRVQLTAREARIASLTKERDEAKALLAHYSGEYAKKGTLANIYIAERDTAIATIATLTKERDALRLAFSEASHNAGPAFVAHQDLADCRATIAAKDRVIGDLVKALEKASEYVVNRGSFCPQFETEQVIAAALSAVQQSTTTKGEE